MFHCIIFSCEVFDVQFDPGRYFQKQVQHSVSFDTSVQVGVSPTETKELSFLWSKDAGCWKIGTPVSKMKVICHH